MAGQPYQKASGGVGYLLKGRVADVAEFTAAITRVAAGVDPIIVNLPRRAKPDSLRPLAEALAPLA